MSFYALAIAVPASLLLAHVIPWFLDPQGVKRYPGPFLAKFSDLWLGYISKTGHRSVTVHEAHKKYGPIVRIAPNHISVADPDALNAIYGHGNGTTKSDFYDAFVSIKAGLFSTRNRADHTRKRKIVSHIFSPKSVLEFEPHLKRHVGRLIERWDQFCDLALKNMSGTDGEGGWEGRNGLLYLNVLPWANYLAFDIIGDLSFGAPFGMLDSGKDIAMVPKHHGNQQAVMNSYGEGKTTDSEVIGIPAVEILNGRGDFAMCMGVLPPHWRQFVSKLPGYRSGSDCVRYLAGISIMAVAKRLANPTDRVDILSKLQSGRDTEGKPMGREELTAEAQTFLIAGSDSSANSITAVIYHIANHPLVQQKLQKELDDRLMEDELVAPADQVKHLPYLEACINEALRVHSTSGVGLPRVAPEGGLTVLGQFFPEGTVLSVPSYTIHRDVNVWGEDVESYRPERWFERDQSTMQKAYNVFSTGPRACVGRNLAVMELRVVIASLFRRYSFVVEQPDQPVSVVALETEELVPKLVMLSSKSGKDF